MMPPTSIDGTDITGATIDGTEVQEITVDGQTVFTAGPTLPVAYSNLVAWYPFDSAEYGGSNADDVTAIIGGSGDDTAYNGTVRDATYQSTGGVTDINAGANSGGFDFDGSNDDITLPAGTFDSTSTFTLSFWFNMDDNTFANIFRTNDNSNGFRIFTENGRVVGGTTLFEDSGSTDEFDESPLIGLNTWAFLGVTFDLNNSQAKIYIASDDISFQNYDTISTTGSGSDPVGPFIGSFGSSNYFNGSIDDVRIYDSSLSSSELQQIYQNTEP